jgi:hypothetical protein
LHRFPVFAEVGKLKAQVWDLGGQESIRYGGANVGARRGAARRGAGAAAAPTAVC